MDPIDVQIAAMSEKAAKLSGRTPLMAACGKLDVQSALNLIERGEDIATSDRFGRTPLHEAARNAYQDEPKALIIVAALLDAGAPVDPAEKQQGLTPLSEAAIYKAPEVLKLLISRGANVNHKMKDRNTILGALTGTTSMMRGRSKIIKILEDAGGTGRKR